MYLFILESIGTTELLLIGIVALIFLGPRRLPEIARKAAKIMAEFRGTANEFKDTWQKEVNFDEEIKAVRLDHPEETTVPREPDSPPSKNISAPVAAEVRSIDASTFNQTTAPDTKQSNANPPETINSKENWL